MTLWLDAQLSPQLASWVSKTFGVESHSVTSLGFRDAEDDVIFQAARKVGAVLMSKDQDFVDLVLRHGPPPQIILVTCGNTSNQALRALLQRTFAGVLESLQSGEPLVELGQATA